MEPTTSDNLSTRLLGCFFRFGRTPWHMVPAAGLSRTETSILLTIDRAMHHNKKLRISDLSTRMRVSSPTITQHINNLEGQGFVTRTQAADDKRAVHLSLTAKGFEALQSHRDAMEKNFSELVETLGAENAELLIKLLTETSDFFDRKRNSYEDENIFDRR